ncbi:MAG: metal-sulfur cluster biosynthetic enzyme, partial [Planctomycetaceae bacterium]
MNDSELRSCVEAVTDPELGRSLGELGMVKQATVSADGA